MAPRHRNLKQKDKNDGVSPSLPTDPDLNAGKNVNQNTSSFVVKVPWMKIALRCLLSFLIILAVYYSSNKEEQNVFARKQDNLQLKSQEVPCSTEKQKQIHFEGCVSKHCGRFVTDIIISNQESRTLLQLCKKGFSLGGSSGGASILDLHSGALSYGNSFVNVYQQVKTHDKDDIFTAEDFKVYKNVRSKIQNVIAFNFGIQANKLHLTHPTFFSKMSSKEAKTTHDEYWHVHVDKETYPSFYYTSLLYLSDYGSDFTGGRFTFVDKNGNVTIEPKMGRVSVFTSGAENPHCVERVKNGIRYALTVSFTCDSKYAISDPSLEKIS